MRVPSGLLADSDAGAARDRKRATDTRAREGRPWKAFVRRSGRESAVSPRMKTKGGHRRAT